MAWVLLKFPFCMLETLVINGYQSCSKKWSILNCHWPLTKAARVLNMNYRTLQRYQKGQEDTNPQELSLETEGCSSLSSHRSTWGHVLH